MLHQRSIFKKLTKKDCHTDLKNAALRILATNDAGEAGKGLLGMVAEMQKGTNYKREEVGRRGSQCGYYRDPRCL